MKRWVWGWVWFGIAGIVMAESGVNAKQREHLRTRCFVWHPNACNNSNRLADEKLVASLTRKLSRPAAAAKVLADAWDTLDNHDDVITALYRFNQVLILDPNEPKAWWGAGAAYLKLNEWAEAKPLLDRAKDLDPKLAGVYVTRARGLVRQKRTREALVEYQKGKQLGAPADAELEKIRAD
jgi:tetratricopeptide (TPR) repeat protein